MSNRFNRTIYYRLLWFIAGIFWAIAVNATDYPPEEYISHTLPVIYINTSGNVPITSKEEYLNATCYIDATDSVGYQSLGSVEQPLQLLIKGRGNSSWACPKKSYRLKFDDKVSPLGIAKNRHFILLAEWSDGHGRLNWETGFFVSRVLGLPWTPAHIPVEVVLNGEYMGLYFLSEKIRVDSNRVNIEEQDDEETNPDLVTGGWLCEIDNTIDTPQITLRDRTTGKIVRTTVHSPEVLSSTQLSYITNLVTDIDNAIYCKDKTSTTWEQLIDLDALVRYYLVCEIVNQIEGFSGSCYWWKERGYDTKINFGPVWDFDTSNAMWKSNMFCYENNEGDEILDRNHWIQEIAKFPRFQHRVRELWHEYCDTIIGLINDHAQEYLAKVSTAAECDIKRWSSYYVDSDIKRTDYRAKKYLKRLATRHQWLCEQWEKPVPIIGDADANGKVNDSDLKTIRRFLLNRSIDTISTINANTYDDNVIDISDLVGIARLLYKNNNPNVVLPEAPSIPYKVDDKAVDNDVRLTIYNLPTNNVWYPDLEREIGLCVSNSPSFSAFSVDVTTSDDLTITGLKVNGIEDDNYLIYRQPIDQNTTRIIGYSNDLKQFETEGENGKEPFFKFTLKVNHEAAETGNYLQIQNLLLADITMMPTRINDMYMPLNMRAKKGDVDGNRIIDVDDVNAMINIILKTEGAGNYIIANADLNNDKIIDVDDVNIIINRILGI